MGTLICAPPGATEFQVAKIIDKYMQDNPQILNLLMHNIALQALTEAFPCR